MPKKKIRLARSFEIEEFHSGEGLWLTLIDEGYEKYASVMLTDRDVDEMCNRLDRRKNPGGER